MRFTTFALALLALVGCGGHRIAAHPSADAGPREDAGPPADAGPPSADMATPLDSGGRDAGTPDAGPPISTHRLLEGVTLDGLAVFQGTRIGLAAAGAAAPTRNAPVVALRDSLVRAYVTLSTARTVSAELEVLEGGAVIAVHRATQVIARSTRDDDPTTALDFRVPAAELTTTASLRARLVDPAGTPETAASHPARLPRDGSTLPLLAEDDGRGLHLVLVPLRWDGDGSGRLPDTSTAWLDSVRALLLSLYPLADLTLTVHAPVPWSDSLTLTGNVDFGSINAMLRDLRTTDGATNESYYYALVAPNATYSGYCGGSCVTGQSYVVDAASDGGYRVGSGVDFGSADSAWTLAHEVGHEYGRYHAPCSTSGADVGYPYAGGQIGVWGWDMRDGTFQAPVATTDFMGYCDPTWISDYTWSAMFTRTLATSALAHRAPERSLLVRLGTERGAVLVGARTLVPPTTRARTRFAWLSRGRVLGSGDAPTLEVSESSERLVVLPAPPALADSVRLDGVVIAFAR